MVNYSCSKCLKEFTQKSHYDRHILNKIPCNNKIDKIKLIVENIVENKIEEIINKKTEEIITKKTEEIKTPRGKIQFSPLKALISPVASACPT